LAQALFAQTSYAQKTGSLSGVVYDPLGEPALGAEVQASAGAGKAFRATTSAQGAYSIPGLPVGKYEVAVLIYGDQRFVREGVAISAGKSAKLDIHIQDDSQLGAIGDNAFSSAMMARKPVPTGPAPRSLDGHPDLSGVWAPVKTVDRGNPDMLPWAAALVKARFADNMKDIPTASCLPWGPTFDVPVTFKFIQAPKTIVMLREDAYPYRQFHMDGRAHPQDADPTWMGHSVGTWEDDTLVVDTVGLNDKGWSPIPYPRTEKFHMIERIRRPDAGHLEIDTTIEDPGTYRKPWTLKLASTLLQNDEIGEYICVENNQYAGHAR
jgi:hypothetical protein